MPITGHIKVNSQTLLNKLKGFTLSKKVNIKFCFVKSLFQRHFNGILKCKISTYPNHFKFQKPSVSQPMFLDPNHQ